MSTMQPMKPHQPNQFQRPEGCRVSKALAHDFCEARPTENSMTMTGRPRMTRNTR